MPCFASEVAPRIGMVTERASLTPETLFAASVCPRLVPLPQKQAGMVCKNEENTVLAHENSPGSQPTDKIEKVLF